MADSPADKPKIFIVEDEFLIAFEMSDVLEDLGFEVVGPSVHLQEALETVEREDMDAALLDVNLGGGETSKPVADRLRERDVPFVYITAYDRNEITFLLPDDQVVRKPITGGVLLDTLRSILPDLEKREV